LEAKCRIGDKECTFGKIDTNEIVGSSKDYTLKEVEIFKVSVETIEKFDDEESKNNFEKEKKDNYKKSNHKKLRKNKSDNTKFKNRK
jgi:hypothetical protein